MTRDHTPFIEQGPDFHVNYQMYEGSGSVSFRGVVVDQNTDFITIRHDDRSNFTESVLWWDHIISVHRLKDDAGEGNFG